MLRLIFALALAVSFSTAHLAGATPDRFGNDAARFLAGLPGAEGSPFKELESDPAWQTHKEKLDAAFGTEQARLAKQREFQKAEIAPHIRAKSCFYPFGGADSWNVNTFFPDCEKYLLVGLEPAGTLSFAESFLSKSRDSMAGRLAAFRGSLQSILSNSFFVTREMDGDYRGQKTDGLLVPMLVLLIRHHDITVEKVSYLWITDSGTTVERNPKDTTVPRATNKMVEISFKKAGASAMQKLYFTTANLGPTTSELRGYPGLQMNSGLLQFLDTFGRVNTFMKATSYMPHRPEFTLIRNNILNRSDLVLQEDTGIPLKYYAGDDWDLRLFGAYSTPIKIFAGYRQPDMVKAYKEEGRAKPLGFAIGYGSKRQASGMQMAVRKAKS
jgi:hypothetical protein